MVFNGVVYENGNLEIGAEAVYSCNTGLSLVGSNNRTCTGDGSSTTGTFDGVAPTCERELTKVSYFDVILNLWCSYIVSFCGCSWQWLIDIHFF